MEENAHNLKKNQNLLSARVCCTCITATHYVYFLDFIFNLWKRFDSQCDIRQWSNAYEWNLIWMLKMSRFDLNSVNFELIWKKSKWLYFQNQFTDNFNSMFSLNYWFHILGIAWFPNIQIPKTIPTIKVSIFCVNRNDGFGSSFVNWNLKRVIQHTFE